MSHDAVLRASRDYRLLKTYHAEVVAAAPVTPRMRRITFGSWDLAQFEAGGPDQFVTILAPHPHQDAPVIPPGFTWEMWRTMPEEERPITRNYTIRRYRPELAEIDVDFVLHEDGGPLCQWAMRAKPGDKVGIWGPRMAYDPPPGVEWQLLVGDETGLPAIAAILEALPAGARAHAIIEVADAAEEQPLPTAGDVEVTWLHRNGIPAGKADLILPAVQALPFPPGRIYAWAAGEVRTIVALRRHFRRERGLAREDVAAVGYWRHHEHQDEDTEE
ncbi:MAG: siderophore-interacting protein [Thermomicrobiales bacterium]|nr:MAG: siderophore-interacting protein [Thermomicrobiales bacterium]